MANAKNLKPQSSRTKSEQREIARKGGIASGVARRRKRTGCQLVAAMLDSSAHPAQKDALKALADGLGDEELTIEAALTAKQIQEASGGSTAAYKVLMDMRASAAEPEQGGEGTVPSMDYGMQIAEPFLAYHRKLAAGSGCDLWIYGGRGSTKSSWVSVELVRLMYAHPDLSALVMMKVGADMGGGVYEQVKWSLELHGVADDWRCTVSPMRMVRKSTGQVIRFKGGDNTQKTKAMKAPEGTYYGILWIEETDQFAGMAELRRVYQSVTRGAPQGKPFYRFHTFNPPRAKNSWANRETADRLAAGNDVIHVNWDQVPREWLPDQFVEDALALKELDQEAYAHEYMGEPVGFGAEVFPRAVVREVPEEERAGLEYRTYGTDWGFSQDPWVWVRVAYDRKRRTLYVLDEMSGKGLGNVETAAMVEEAMEGERFAPVFCDAAEPKSIAEWRDLGVNAMAAPKQGTHNVRNGVKWLQNRAQIVVDPRCRIAAREFSEYAYELTKDGEPTGLLPDRDNHAIDAVRYACTKLIDDRNNL